MALERTLSIIKPDGVAKNVVGAIVNRFETAGLRVVAQQRQHLSKEKADGLYAEHSERPFFGPLAEYMTSGPIGVIALQGEDARRKDRDIKRATTPQDPPAGTLRADLAETLDENA